MKGQGQCNTQHISSDTLFHAAVCRGIDALRMSVSPSVHSVDLEGNDHIEEISELSSGLDSRWSDESDASSDFLS